MSAALSARGIETALLGTMIESRGARIDAQRILNRDDLATQASKTIWEAIGALAENCSFLTLQERLTARGELERIGGAPMIGDLLSAATGAEHVGYFAEQIIEARNRRRGLRITSELARNLADGETEPETAIAEATAALGALAVGKSEQPNIREDVLTTMERLDSEASGATSAGIKTRWPAFNACVILRPGSFLVIAGATSSGKSLLGGNIASDVIGQGGRALLFSYEMTRDDIVRRLLCDRSGVPPSRFFAPAGNKMTRPEAQAVDEAQQWLAGSDLHIFDDAGITIDKLAAIVRAYHAERPVDAVVVDYLQLIPDALRNAPREQQVAHASRALRRIGLETGAVIVALSQVNEDGQVRESRAIKQDAEIVLHIEADHLWVLKNRNGERNFELPICQQVGALRFHQIG